MSCKSFELFSCVWAKMKGFPPWPAQIIDFPDDGKPQPKNCHHVQFFGTNDTSWISNKNIAIHTEKKFSEAKNKKSKFLKAVQDLKDYLNRDFDEEPMEEQQSHSDVSMPMKMSTKRPLSEDESDGVPSRITVDTFTPASDVSMPMKMSTKRPRSEDKSDGMSSRITVDTFSAASPSTSNESQFVNKSYEDDLQCYLSAPEEMEYILFPYLPLAEDVENVNESLIEPVIEPLNKNIGFIGLEMLGLTIVKRLLESGHSVTICDSLAINRKKCADWGASTVLTPAEVATKCSTIFCYAIHSKFTKSLLLQDNGILQGFKANRSKYKSLIELNNYIGSDSSKEIEDLLTQNMHFLEASILSSGPLPGQLFLLCCGSPFLFNDCSSCFEAIASNYYFLSTKVEDSPNMKLVYSMFMSIKYAAMAEVVSFCKSHNLDPSCLLEALKLGPFKNSPVLAHALAKCAGGMSIAGPKATQHADLEMALTLGNSCSQPLPIAEASNELFKTANQCQNSGIITEQDVAV